MEVDFCVHISSKVNFSPEYWCFINCPSLSVLFVQQRLGQSGRTCSHLREEIRLLQSVTVDESVQGVKDTVAMILQNELAWQQEYEKALEKCGFEIKGAEQGRRYFLLFFNKVAR